MYKLICSFGQEKIFFGQVHHGNLLVPGQVENVTISTPLTNVIDIFYFQDFDSDSDWDVSPVEDDDPKPRQK